MNAAVPAAATAPAGAVVVARAPLEHFAPSLTNRTHDRAYIENELAPSLDPDGVLQPITARPWPASRGEPPKGVLYEIVIGEGRWLASKFKKLPDIPFFWRNIDDRTALRMQLVENLKRKNLTPIEEAEGYRRLMQEHGLSADQVAQEIGEKGKSRSYVYGRLKLLDLGDAAREALSAGKLTASTALLVARIPGETLQKKAIKEITKGYDGEPLSYRNAENHIHHNFTLSLKQATFPPDDAELVPAAGSCADCPKRSGNAPEICADIKDADVCTDTQCFDDKRLTRRQQLIAAAEKRKIPVYAGDKAREFAPAGLYSLNEDQYVSLDEVVDGDGQERTYREILGDQAPVIALLETGYTDRSKKLVELGDPTALEKALNRSGWQPDLFKDSATKTDSEKQRAEREARIAEENRKKALRDAEVAWREAVAEKIAAELKDNNPTAAYQLHRALLVLTELLLRREAEYLEIDGDLYERHGLALPDEFDEDDEDDELAKIPDRIKDWTSGQAIALMFDALLFETLRPEWPGVEGFKAPRALLAAAELVDIDAEALRKPAEPASTPSEAAQAREEVAPKPAAPAKGKAKEVAPAKTEETPVPAPAAPAKDGKKPTVSYAHPENPGLTWSGKGKKPAWVQDWLKEPTHSLDDLKAKTDPAPASPANEPATPVEKPAPAKPTRAVWPFPTGSRP